MKKKSQEQSQSPRTCQIDLPNVSIVCEYVADHLRSWNPHWIIGKVLENRENMRNLLHITASKLLIYNEGCRQDYRNQIINGVI